MLALATAACVIVVGRSAYGGTASLAWDPVPDSDVAGYHLYYGTASRVYTQSVDVGNVTQTTISGLTDCTNYFFAVKAYDTGANESTSYSNEIQGWPRPVVASATPSTAEQGRTLRLTIAGSNFQTGAMADFSSAGITVNSTSVNACGQLTINITIGDTATVGASDLSVTNSDGTSGTRTAIFTVHAANPPTVVSTTPADGATGAATTATPTVTFNGAMLAASITATNVKLVDHTGAAVAQRAGSPSLSANGLTATISPETNLMHDETYRIQVVGGASGVLDIANHAMTNTFTQTAGFTTSADTTLPIITAVAASDVGSTTATITWTTDEATDGNVFYRKPGATTYQQTSIDATLVTSHTSHLAGLEPSTTYEYYVRSVDADGNAASSSPTETFATTANNFAYLRFEAESGRLAAPVRENLGAPRAFGSGYIDTPPETPEGDATSPAGTATFGVNIPSSGTWYLWVRMYGADFARDRWYESINGAARQRLFPTVTGQWQWVAAGRSYALTAGLASLELGAGEAQARADRVLMTNDPTFVPTEQPMDDEMPPDSDTAVTATGGAGQVTLAWTNSWSIDFSQTIIRYRTDGRFPVSPVDGFAVVESSGAVGSTDSFVHTGLIDGTTYYYSAFAQDTSGNVSSVANAAAIPGDATQGPTRPSGLTATAGATDRVDLNWMASTDDAGVTGYRIEQCQGTACTDFTEIAQVESTSYSVTGLSPGTYRYRVRAEDAAGNVGPYSDVASATIPAIWLVQHRGLDAGSTESSLAFTRTNAAGNLIVVAIRAGRSNRAPTVTDSAGNTYRQAIEFDNTFDGMSVGIYFAENIAGGSNAVTVSKPQPHADLHFAIFEYSGVALTASLDQTSGREGSSATPDSGTITPTFDGELVIGVVATANEESFTGGDGYVINENVPEGPYTKLMVEDQTQAARSSVSAGATLRSSDDWAAVVATFRGR